MNICVIGSPRPAAHEIVRQRVDRFGKCDLAAAAVKGVNKLLGVSLERERGE